MPVRLEFRHRPRGDHDVEPVRGRDEADAALVARIEVEVAGERQPAPVGVVQHRLRRRLVIDRRSDGIGHGRSNAVRPDHDGRPLRHGHARRSTTDTTDDTVLGDEGVDREARPNLGAGRGGGLDEDGVDREPPRCVGPWRRRQAARRPGDGERPEVEAVGRHRRTTGRNDRVRQAPALQGGHAGRVDEVRRDRVARERGPIDQQHAVAQVRQQHGGGCAGDAGTDDDDVVVAHPMWPPCGCRLSVGRRARGASVSSPISRRDPRFRCAPRTRPPRCARRRRACRARSRRGARRSFE